MAVKLSKPGKMPCPSWSLQALTTCPASKDKHGELVPACAGCYATDGNYLFPAVKAVRAHNMDDWRRDDWVPDMVRALDTHRYFRWFDSGDMYHIGLAKKILQVMRLTPWCHHWLPTRMHKLAKFKPVIVAMERLSTVAVRKSGDGIRGEVIRGKTVSTIFNQETQDAPAGAVICPAYKNAGKCGDCRQCWDKSIPVIAYPQHGRKMVKQDNNIIARLAA